MKRGTHRERAVGWQALSEVKRSQTIRCKRVYEPSAPGDGYRLLIDRMWPRGISRERAALDEWARDLAPSDELRQWYGHAPDRFEEFRRRYRAELAAHDTELRVLRRRARSGPLTIVFAARDSEHSNAAVLAEVLRDPAGSGPAPPARRVAGRK
jgi:uncharacterized protein YeaO (DUF488 family)